MSNNSWETWFIPKNYSLNWHDEQSLMIGVSGYGDISPNQLKITLYSEEDSKIRAEGEKEYKNNTYIIAGDPSNSSLYTKQAQAPYPNHIFLETDHTSVFKRMFIKPGSTGQKKLAIVLTYFNGENWVTKKSTFEYKVLSFTEKHQTIITILAIIGGVVAINQLVELVF